jgi:pilus assembly protein CpaE
MMALEGLALSDIDGLVSGLRRDMALTLIDLPSAWTAWTNHALQMADSIVVVTRLTVPHIHLVKRQLRMLGAQQLDADAVVLVCNGVSSDQLNSLPLKAAERALGRPFDVVIPDDARTMTAAINEGVALADVRRGTKLEKALSPLVAKLPIVEAHTPRLEVKS